MLWIPGDVVQMLYHRVTVTTSHTMAIKEQKQFDCLFHNAANIHARNTEVTSCFVLQVIID